MPEHASSGDQPHRGCEHEQLRTGQASPIRLAHRFDLRKRCGREGEADRLDGEYPEDHAPKMNAGEQAADERPEQGRHAPDAGQAGEDVRPLPLLEAPAHRDIAEAHHKTRPCALEQPAREEGPD